MSSETTWLPGPWQYSSGSIWAITPWNARVRILDVGTLSPMNGVDSTAIGHVAAASPKLYDALAALVEAYEQVGPVMTLDEYHAGRLALIAARTALASARGEG